MAIGLVTLLAPFPNLYVFYIVNMVSTNAIEEVLRSLGI
jgi:hypothetical protein